VSALREPSWAARSQGYTLLRSHLLTHRLSPLSPLAGITVSREQLVEAQARVKAAGVADRVTLLFCDYRDVTGTYDAVVSCEMIEAVGHEHLPTYFAVAGRALKPGGYFAMQARRVEVPACCQRKRGDLLAAQASLLAPRSPNCSLPAITHSSDPSETATSSNPATLQVITMPDVRYEAYCNSSDFIREHIFPGGHLPSMAAMIACAGSAGLAAVGVRDVGPDYAVTLRAWRQNWTAQWDEIRALGYSEAFMRKCALGLRGRGRGCDLAVRDLDVRSLAPHRSSTLDLQPLHPSRFEFYFAYCEAPFDSGYLANYQITWQRDSSAPASAAETPEPVSPSKPAPPLDHAPRSARSDPITAALVGVYFLLVGVAVGQQPHMLMAPLACALSAAVFQAARYAAVVLLPGFARLPPRSQAWWALDCVHLAASALLGGCSCALLLRAPALTGVWPQQPSSFASLLVSGKGSGVEDGCTATCSLTAFPLQVSSATGFFGFQLYGLLQCGLHQRCPRALLHFTILLLLFGVGAFKRQHIGLLALTLPAEVAALPHLVRVMGQGSRVERGWS